MNIKDKPGREPDYTFTGQYVLLFITIIGGGLMVYAGSRLFTLLIGQTVYVWLLFFAGLSLMTIVVLKVNRGRTNTRDNEGKRSGRDGEQGKG